MHYSESSISNVYEVAELSTKQGRFWEGISIVFLASRQVSKTDRCAAPAMTGGALVGTKIQKFLGQLFTKSCRFLLVFEVGLDFAF
jgi:hypothetical protein